MKTYFDLNEFGRDKVHMGPARFTLDLSDGSERGEYVDQDYILSRLGRPHRAVNLMYCYYPLDKTWPARAHDAFPDQKIENQWDYPYDDYFVYQGGKGGNTDGEPFQQMRDVRRHGQDVTLTLTIDPNVSDEELYAIAVDLKPFGQMMLRINHEATGDWFSFTKRAGYQQIADFYVRFHKIIKEVAPQIRTILCIGGMEDPAVDEDGDPVTYDSPCVKEKEFTEAIRATDIWAVDKYLALHWGWPVDVADSSTSQYNRCNVARVYELTKMSYERFCKLSDGKARPMQMAEFNADGDVTGPFDQIGAFHEFLKLRSADDDWLTSICMYQFRDRGRLGLEIEDPNNKNVGIPQPLLADYRSVLHSDLCYPRIENVQGQEDMNLDWRAADDATGVRVYVPLERTPVFFELYFEGDQVEENLMIECNTDNNHRWFYKKPGVNFIDLMPSFFDAPGRHAKRCTLTFFAPPKDGVNEITDDPESLYSYRYTLKGLPKLRIEYDPILREPEGWKAAGNKTGDEEA